MQTKPSIILNHRSPKINFEKCIEDLGTIRGWKKAYPILTEAGPAALEAVLKGMMHSNWRVRMWCASFMDHFADERCVPAMVIALNDPIARVRRHAVHGLGCQACKPEPLRIDLVPLLIDKALRDSSIGVRRSAAHMLGNQAPDKRIELALSEAVKYEKDAKFKRCAGWALRKREPKPEFCAVR